MNDDPELSADPVVHDELAALDPERRDMSLPALVLRRMTGTYQVDQWGFDADLAVALAPLASIRHRVLIDGAQHLPEIGPALLVTNHRLDPLEPLAITAALARGVGRIVRCAGVPDLAPVGPLLRRLGGVSSNSADLRSLFRSGELVLCAGRHSVGRPFGGARVDRDALAVALATGTPVVPVSVRGFELGRIRSVTVGAPIAVRRGVPETVDELATLTTHRLADLAASLSSD